MKLTDKIKQYHPCGEAVKWLSSYDDPQTAWNECQRADWMLWLLGNQITSPPWSEDRKPLLSCCLEMAETVKHLWPVDYKDRIGSAIVALRRWIEGDATIEEAKVARSNLYDYAYADADAAYAADAAAAAAAYVDAADAAYADAADAAYAAYAAYTAATYAADAAAGSKSLSVSADIVRKHFPSPPKLN
jgi:hypothetical protein